MERIKNTHILYTLLFVLVAGMMWGCVDDSVVDIPTNIEGNKHIEGSVTISLKIPTVSNNPSTRANSLSANDANTINEIAINANVGQTNGVNERAAGINTRNTSGESEIPVNEINVDEDAVAEIALLLFDGNGYTYQPIYISSSNMIFNNGIIENFTAKVPVGTYKMVVLANANKSLSKAFENNKIKVGNSKADVLKELLYTHPYDNSSDLFTLAKWNGVEIPMWGETINNVTIGSEIPVTVDGIELVRMVAKIDVELTSTAATNFTLESVRLYNYNTVGQVAPNAFTWQVEPSIPSLSSIVKGPLVYKPTTNTTSYTNKIYTFEAVKGSVDSLPTNTSFVIGVKNKSDNKVSFHRIDFVNETVYLDLKRNHNYKVSIAEIKGQGYTNPEDAFDSTPIESDITESNSYIVAPNSGKLYIPVSRANQSLLGTQLKENEAFTAELVWTDNKNKISSNSNIKYIGEEGTGPTGYLVVEPGTAEGNAVVAIKNTAGKVLWSWHIWVTKYEPNMNNKFMDRNLGAMSNTPGNPKTHGLMYQWGRKDPFPGSTQKNNGVDPTLYTITGTINVVVGNDVQSNNLANAFANPLTYYVNSSTPFDWYRTSAGAENNKLWDPTIKSVYDPCPPGWRVPKTTSVWQGLDNTNFKWVHDNLGRTNESYGGFYPGAGRRGNDNLNYQSVGSSGRYWSSVANGISASALDFDNGSTVYLNPNGNYRAHAVSVRCVRE